MNKTRRKELQLVIDELENQKARVIELLAEEQEYYDNMPEAFQEGERGQQSQSAIDALESVEGSIDEAIQNIEEAINA